MNNRSFLYSVLIAGAGMALLGNLPLVNLINCILCLWVWLGGAAAVLLYRRFQRNAPALTGGQGAGLGAVAGLVGAVLGFGVYLLTAAVTNPILLSLARTLDVDLNLPEAGAGGALGGALFFLLLDLIAYPLFGALGGLITANMGNKSTAPPAAV
jgi:hypothetical protein